MNIILDTHVLVWRYLSPKKLSLKERNLFLHGKNRFLIPTVVLLELKYLIEIGRLDLDMDEFLTRFRNREDFDIISFDEAALLQSLKLSTTRDPFDRMILAQAKALDTPLLTRDKWMKRTAPQLMAV